MAGHENKQTFFFPAAIRPHSSPAFSLQMSTKYAHFHKLPEASLEALKQAALK